MPLFGVAQWIATKGGNVTHLHVNDTQTWLLPVAVLLTSAGSGELTVYGNPKDAPKVPVPSSIFRGCKIVYPYRDPSDAFQDGHGVFLRLVDYEYPGDLPEADDPDDLVPHFSLEWHGTMNDTLWSQGEIIFSHLTCDRRNVRKLWPASAWAVATPPVKAAVVAEFERRHDEGASKKSIRERTRILTLWFNDKYPNYRGGGKPVAEETVRAYVRSRYYELWPG